MAAPEERREKPRRQPEGKRHGRDCGPRLARFLLPGRETRAGRQMDNFLQKLFNGITLGSIYGLIAIGYTMVFGIIGMVNFAHGDVFMLSAFIALLVFLLLTKVIGLTFLPLTFVLVLVA